MSRPIYAIAADVWEDWGEKVNYAARPYLEAMDTIESIHDMYYYDTADSVVRYFLANATSWRGETARTIKAELRGVLK